jgi:hypothetical protein
MRIAIWNINGNAGKSTLANRVLLPRLPSDAEVIYVESDNSIPGKIAGAKEFQAETDDWSELLEYLSNNIVDHDIIVDIGSTDSKKVKSLFIEYAGSLDEFDLFVVPHSPDCKQVDTALTIDFLQEKGIPRNKIKLVFNNIVGGSNPERTFADIYNYWLKHENCIFDSRASISQTALFKRIEGTEWTVESLVADETDWNEKIKKASPQKDDPKVKEAIDYYSWMKINKMQAITMNKQFNSMFELVMAPCAEDDLTNPA